MKEASSVGSCFQPSSFRLHPFLQAVAMQSKPWSCHLDGLTSPPLPIPPGQTVVLMGMHLLLFDRSIGIESVFAYKRPEQEAGDCAEEPIRPRPDAMSFIMKRCEALIQPGMKARVLLGQRDPVTRARPHPIRPHANLPGCMRALCALERFVGRMAEILGQAMNRQRI